MKTSSQAFEEAISEARKGRKRNFDQSFELIVNLSGVDISKPDKRFTEHVELPNGLEGKARRVCVIASGNLALQARRMDDVDVVFERRQIEEIIGNKKEARRIANRYDYFIVEAPMMGTAARALGAALGARGKTPVPMTPRDDLGELVKRYRRSVTIRLRKTPRISCLVGTEKMEDQDVAGNADTVLTLISERLEKKFQNIASVYVKTTMGSPVKVELEEK